MTSHPLQSQTGDLDEAVRTFESWRSTRTRGTRIPETLWRLAIELAQCHGVSQTSQALHLDYYALKKRLESEAGPGSTATSQPGERFIELSIPGRASPPTYTLELEDGGGKRMRLELKGVSAEELATFARALWSHAQ